MLTYLSQNFILFQEQLFCESSPSIMKFIYGSAIFTLVTGAVCHVINPSVNLLPQAGTQNILSDNDYAVPGHNPFEYCYSDHENDRLQIDYINVDPYPFKKYEISQKGAQFCSWLTNCRGQTLSFDLVGQLLEDVREGAYIIVTIKLGVIQILRKTFDLCENASRANVTCPIEKGPIKFHSEIEIPETVPPAEFHLEAVVYSNYDEDIFCLRSTINFKSPRPNYKN
ncbi:hypothetical protein Golomagni_04670 [Golovinomyces magnicellulatus]|nr:hypothetical protein Golomagni_04670 [Golovinomyces magnicellulatus]